MLPASVYISILIVSVITDIGVVVRFYTYVPQFTISLKKGTTARITWNTKNFKFFSTIIYTIKGVLKSAIISNLIYNVVASMESACTIIIWLIISITNGSRPTPSSELKNFAFDDTLISVPKVDIIYSFHCISFFIF